MFQSLDDNGQLPGARLEFGDGKKDRGSASFCFGGKKKEFS